MVFAHNALLQKLNTIICTKNSKNTGCLGGCSILNALNLEKWGVKIPNCALLMDFFALFWLYRMHALIL